jgi:hypothetical protein
MTYSLELSGDYWLRITGFLLASLTILGGVSLGGYLMPFLRKPSNLVNPRYMKDVLESTALLFGSERGVFGSSFMHILEYYVQAFIQMTMILLRIWRITKSGYLILKRDYCHHISLKNLYHLYVQLTHNLSKYEITEKQI